MLYHNAGSLFNVFMAGESHCIGKGGLKGLLIFLINRPSMAPLATLSDTSPRRHRPINWNRFL